MHKLFSDNFYFARVQLLLLWQVAAIDFSKDCHQFYHGFIVPFLLVNLTANFAIMFYSCNSSTRQLYFEAIIHTRKVCNVFHFRIKLNQTTHEIIVNEEFQ